VRAAVSLSSELSRSSGGQMSIPAGKDDNCLTIKMGIRLQS